MQHDRSRTAIRRRVPGMLASLELQSRDLEFARARWPLVCRNGTTGGERTGDCARHGLSRRGRAADVRCFWVRPSCEQRLHCYGMNRRG